MTYLITRRDLLKNGTISSAAIMLGTNEISRSQPKGSVITPYPVMRDVMKYRKLDAHAHVGLSPGDTEKQLDIADRLGITKMCISKPVTNFSGTEPEGPEEVRRCNDVVIQAVRSHPDRYFGFFTLNPIFQEESLEEIKRCVDNGLIGYKGYTQVKINDPLYYPLIERFIDLKMLILVHAFCQLGLGGYRMKYDIGKAPHTSIPEDFADIARRYPEAIFQFAHIGGGADWEYECKALKDHPNVFVDTAGSNNEANIIDFAIRHLGEDRLFFGTDSSYYQAVGQILASDTTEAQKHKIFYGNYSSVLKRLGKHVA
jgi:predicted TIM-barrel fold metal-dependent hydrolase